MSSNITLSGWGRYPASASRVVKADTENDILMAIADQGSLIARGMGRSYGDAALGVNTTLFMERRNRLISFDPGTGLVTCEAGVLLSDLLQVMIGRGWFVPVSPGTRFVTMGGMVACDVHGKNHHIAGSFGRHVEKLVIALADGRIVGCSRVEDPDLFHATIGGMGLTGVILELSFRLIKIGSPLIRRRTLRAQSLPELLDLIEDNKHSTYSVAWIDGLGDHAGRGILQLGEHAETEVISRPWTGFKNRQLCIPFDFPSITLNHANLSLFNALYYYISQDREDLTDLERFFYPLDGIRNWPRLYGGRGFVQHQCVLPSAAARKGLAVLLDRMSKRKMGACLGVLKSMGRQEGLLSFPMEGFTLALDFPVGPDTLALLDEFDAIVSDFGGRLYLAKDARTQPERIEQGYPRLKEFRRLRAIYDPDRRFESLLSRRLAL